MSYRAPRIHPRIASRHPAGFTYLAVLFAIVVMGVVLAGAGQVWSTAAKRERERELLFIGNQFRQAIGRYYESSPGAKQYPAKLEELLEDRRFPKPQRYLRKMYVDPMTGRAEWGLVKAGDRITGVYSLSEDTPLKSGNFSKLDNEFAQRSRYADWRFIYRADAASPANQPEVVVVRDSADKRATDVGTGIAADAVRLIEDTPERKK